mgnify:FL=1
MSDYFSIFLIVKYNDVKVRDITRRIGFSKKRLSDPLLFLPYTIREGEKPEDVSFYYYGSVDYTWLVLMANDLVDPYNDWPLDQDQFNCTFMKKYEELSGETDYDVIAWGQSEANDDNIVFFYKEDEHGKTVQVGPQTFDGNNASNIGGWTAMRLYDYELMLNEEKRNIQLVDALYKDKIDAEFRKLIVK